MRVILFACAESAAIDQASNRISIFNLLEGKLSWVYENVSLETHFSSVRELWPHTSKVPVRGSDGPRIYRVF